MIDNIPLYTADTSALSFPVFSMETVRSRDVLRRDFLPPVTYGTFSTLIDSVLFGVIAPGWSLVKPLFITIEQDDDGCYLASDDLFAVYGVGDTPSDALQDYIQSLTGYYELVAEQAGQDALDLAVFHRVQRYLRKTSP